MKMHRNRQILIQWHGEHRETGPIGNPDLFARVEKALKDEDESLYVSLIQEIHGGGARSARKQLVLTPLQEVILDALDGKAFKLEDLEFEINKSRSSIFGSRTTKEGGLKELIEVGLVANKSGLGYYRTDRPPPDKCATI